jgi:serine/threonine protein kinase
MKIVDFPALAMSFRECGLSADTLRATLLQEVDVMRSMRHRNIVYLEDAFWVGERLHMCLELVEGKDLLRCIPPGGMEDDVARGFFFQLCSAVAFCHANNVCHFPLSLSHTSSLLLSNALAAQVIHGDLKPENILVRERDSRLKLIDFGFSHVVGPGEKLEVWQRVLEIPLPVRNLFSTFSLSTSLSRCWVALCCTPLLTIRK